MKFEIIKQDEFIIQSIIEIIQEKIFIENDGYSADNLFADPTLG